MNLEELTARSQHTAQELEKIRNEKIKLVSYIQDAQANLTLLEGWEAEYCQLQQRIEAVFNRQAEIEKLERERTTLTARYSQIVTEIAEVNTQLANVQTQLAQFATTPPTPTTTTGGGVLGTGTGTGVVTQPSYPAAFTTYQPPQPQPTFTPPPPPPAVLQHVTPTQPSPAQLQTQPQPQQLVNEVGAAGGTGTVEALNSSEAEAKPAETIEREGQTGTKPRQGQELTPPPPAETMPVPAPATTPSSPDTLPAITFQPTANTVSKNGHHAPTVPT